MEGRRVKTRPSRRSHPTNPFPPQSPTAHLKILDGQVGDFLSYWGFKRIHGRIWLHLFTSRSPLDTSELMSRLNVSKGLMSIAMRELLEYRVILPTASGPHGTVYYEANTDLQEVITNVLKNREQVMLQKTCDACQAILSLPPKDIDKLSLDPERLRSVLALTLSASDVLETFLALSKSDDPAIFNSFSRGDSSA